MYLNHPIVYLSLPPSGLCLGRMKRLPSMSVECTEQWLQREHMLLLEHMRSNVSISLKVAR